MGLRRLLSISILGMTLGVFTAVHPVTAQQTCPLLGATAHRVADQQDCAAIAQALCRFLSPQSSDDGFRRIVAIAVEQPLIGFTTGPSYFVGRFRSPLPWPISLVYWLRLTIIRSPDNSGRMTQVHASYRPF